jgi:hypothetical protein
MPLEHLKDLAADFRQVVFGMEEERGLSCCRLHGGDTLEIRVCQKLGTQGIQICCSQSHWRTAPARKA